MVDYYKNIHIEIDTELEFGKYKGEVASEILENDPEYLAWLSDQGISMSDDILEKLDD